jgi:hypothetical protein
VTEDEIRRVYAIAMAYDNRKLSEANITAWWEQAERNRWTFDDAREAIHTHHCESTEYLMPAHITAIIRRKRQQQPPVAEAIALPAAPPAQPARIRGLVADLANRLGWRRHVPDDPALAVECPYCHARPRRPCTRTIGNGHRRGEIVPIRDIHESRRKLAAKASVPPGLCTNTFTGLGGNTYSCELRSGHAGRHECGGMTWAGFGSQQ